MTDKEQEQSSNQETPAIRLIMVAGPNGSGKTTLTDKLRASKTLELPENYVNPDDLAKTITGATAEERNRKAQILADQQRAEWIRNGESFAFETVMSHPSKLGLIQQAKAAGYEVSLIFVCLDDPLTNVKRVEDRVKAGGHDVPENRIRSRYEKTLSLLPHAVELSDFAYIYDNSSLDIPHILQAICQEEEVVYLNENVVPWVTECLLNPLEIRRTEREQFAKHGHTLRTANLQQSQQCGVILEVGSQLVLQHSGKNEAVIHDLAILKTATDYQANLIKDQSSRIRYDDGQPTIQAKTQDKDQSR